MPLPRVVIPGDDPPQLQGSPHLERLRTAADVTLWPDRPEGDDEKVRRAAGAVVLVNSRSAVKWPGSVLQRLPTLRMLTVCGIGTDSIDLVAARECGILVCNIPGQTAQIVAEHALALMLAVARKLVEQTALVKAGGWRTDFNLSLRGKTLGVVGTGPIGAAMIGLGRAIGMKPQAWTFHASAERAQVLGVPFVSLEELLRTSDVVSLHVPLTEQTWHLIGANEIAAMKPGAILVNTARGAVVDSMALAAALRSGQLAGAGLDVFATEPVPGDDPLLTCPNVVLTPHVADQNPEGMELLNAGVVDNVLAFLAGKLRNVVA